MLTDQAGVDQPGVARHPKAIWAARKVLQGPARLAAACVYPEAMPTVTSKHHRGLVWVPPTMNSASRDPQLPRHRSRSQAIVLACRLEGERRDFDIVVPGTPPSEQGATRPRSMGHGSVRGLFLRMTGAVRDRMMKVIVV
jgi:hypothetical protein